MKKSVQNIALLLLVFITYPFVFQALHILYHDHGHSLDNSENGLVYICLPPAGVCSGHHDTRDLSAIPQLPFPVIGTVPDSETGGNHCPLCEHDFAKFRVSNVYQIVYGNENFSLVNTNFYQIPPVLFTGNHISLRAPPRLS
jgi:hypothetical protein